MNLKEMFFRRKVSYNKVFNRDDQNAQRVLADLQKFCRGRGSKFMGNSESTLVMVGRNEVWERIQSYLNIPDSQLAKMTEIDDE